MVLPRISDAVEGMGDLMEVCQGSGEVTLVVLDFNDTFKLVSVHDSERRFIGGCARGRVFVYATNLFGVGSGPLIWRRGSSRCTKDHPVYGHVLEQIELLRGRHSVGHLVNTESKTEEPPSRDSLVAGPQLVDCVPAG